MICPDCGKDHSPKVPKSVSAPLTDWQKGWDAARSAIKPGPTVSALAGILRKSEEAQRAGKPWGAGAPTMRFRAIFKRMPRAEEYAAARNFLRAAAAFPAET